MSRGDVRREGNEGEPTWWKENKEVILSMPVDLNKILKMTARWTDARDPSTVAGRLAQGDTGESQEIEQIFDIDMGDFLGGIQAEMREVRSFLADEIIDYQQAKGVTIGTLKDFLPFLRDRLHTHPDLVEQIVWMVIQAAIGAELEIKQLITNIGAAMRRERGFRLDPDPEMEGSLCRTTCLMPLRDIIVKKLKAGEL